MIEMYVENEKMDVSAEISSLLTYSIDDIKDFSSRNSSFSKTIVLPGTSNNNKLLGNIFDVKTSNPYDSDSDNIELNYNASAVAQCVIFQDNIQIFKGIFRILEIVIVNNIPEYECAVFGELGGLVLALGNSKIEDLDFSDYDMFYTAPNVSGSWDNPGGSGIYFPLIDYGLVSTDKINFDILAFRPAFYVKEILDKMFENAEYSYESDIFNTSRFKKLIVPNNQKLLYNRQTVALEALMTGHTYTGTTPELIAWTALTIAGGFVLSGGNTVMTYSGATIIGSIDFYTPVDIVSGFAPPYEIQVLQNGVEIGIVSVVVPMPPTGDIDFTIDGVTINNGDTLSVKIIPPPFGTPQLILGTTLLHVNNSAAAPVQVNYNEFIKVNGGLPQNVLQVDFLSSIIKLFNLYLYEDPLESKKVFITPYVDFYETNVSGVTSWDYKLDRGKRISLKPMSELTSRVYNFKFKNDSDYYNDLYQKNYNAGFGDYLYDSEFPFANAKTDIELIFSASPLVGYSGVDKIMTAIYKISNSTEENIGSNIRIMQTKKVTGVTSWNLLNGVSTLCSQTVYGYAGNYDDPDVPGNDIHFGIPKELYFTLASGAINVTQFNVYWSPYMAEITDKDSMLLSAFFKLTNKDIYNLDFSKPIYVNGVYWRLNKVEDWNASNPDVVKCEMLKIINLIY